jgi:Leucine-rich repeat (LRR) protein
MRELPKTFGKLQKLKVLILNFNKLEELPEDLARMQLLTELQVRWNSLYEFPACVTKIPSLQVQFASYHY